MHNRQSGAAHVPIMFFLILLVMFLAALGFAYVTQADNGQLIKERDAAVAEAKAAQNQKLLVEHYIDDIGGVIAKPGTYEGRERSKSLYQDAKLEYPLMMNPDAVRKLMDDASQTAGVSKASGLENVLGSMVARIKQQGERIKDIESQRDKALAEKSEIDRKFQAATADANTRARDFSQTLDQTSTQFEAAKSDNQRLIASLTQNLNDKRDELATAKEAAVVREKSLDAEIRKHQMQNSALVARDAMRNPVDAADGKILVARSELPTAFINLGKKDMLQTGTIFRVRNPNNENVKAYATVQRVEEERAEVVLSGVVDPIGDAVREGDLLFNDLYTPRVSRTIYLMGRFSAPYSQPELAGLLKRLGNKVVTKMVPGVDTVILGDDPVNEEGDGFAKVTDSVEYKEALDLRVEFASLRKIRDLIKL